MVLQLKKAQRSQAFLKLGMSAPSGGGKTLGALLIAYGLMKEKYPELSDEERWDKIVIIDTENGSGELYSGTEVAGIRIKQYNAITLKAPFTAEKYTQALELSREAGMEVCIIDSSSHLWSGEGGLLEQQQIAAKRSGNSYTAWRDITPQHNKFVETMLQTPMHIIATMRSKQEYVQEKDSNTGKSTVRKLGLEPEQRKGMEYEFTTFFEIDVDHMAYGSKDRTSIFDNRQFKIEPKVGQTLMQWLMSGVDTPSEVVASSNSHKTNPEEAKVDLKAEIIEICKELGGSKNETLMDVLKKYTPNGNPNSIKDEVKLGNLRSELLELKSSNVAVAE